MARRRRTVSELLIDVTARRGAFTLDVSLQAAAGEVLAVLGPNGAGKSSLLDAVVGRLTPNRGRVLVGDRTLFDSSRGVQVPPERRRTGLLSQSPSLFPHLSALENVAFGPRAAGVPRIDARATARRLLDAVGLHEHEDRRPARLSGGQQQRVALARALAAEPDVLLLDEPFSALDVATAADMRMLMAETLQRTGTTSMIVTHDVVDALSLAERCVVLDAGRVVDGGRLDDVLGTPRTPFVAALAGTNVVAGTVVAGTVVAGTIASGTTVAGTVAADGVLTTHDGWTLHGRPRGALAKDAPAFASFSPASVRIDETAAPHENKDLETTPQENTTHAIVDRWERGPGGVRVRFAEGLLADIGAAEFAARGLRRGDRVALSVPACDVVVYPVTPRSHPTAPTTTTSTSTSVTGCLPS